MFNINGFELILIVTLFVLLFGPDRLPEVMGQAGRILRDVRRVTDEATADLRRELELASRESSPRRSGQSYVSTAPQGPPPAGASEAGRDVAPAAASRPQGPDAPEDEQAAPSIFRRVQAERPPDAGGEPIATAPDRAAGPGPADPPGIDRPGREANGT